MSGVINLRKTQDHVDQTRYMRMLQRCMNISSAQSNVPSNSESTYGLNLGRSIENPSVQHNNLPIASQQFYHQQANETSNLPASATSTYSQSQASVFRMPQTASQSDSSVFRMPQTASQSDSSVFRMPQTTRQYSVWSYYKNRIDFLMSQLKAIEDKAAFKFLIRLMENAVHTIQYEQYPNVTNPTMLVDYITNLVKDKYYSNRIPASISSSASMISDQTSNVDLQPRVAMNRIDNMSRLLPEWNNQAAPLAPVLEMSQNTQTGERVTSNRPVEVTDSSRNTDHSITCLFTDSQLAQRRDEEMILAASNNVSITKARQASSKPKPNNKRKSTEKSMKEDILATQLSAQNANSTIQQPAGAKGLSRTGRPIKSPVKFWKGNESQVNGSARVRGRKNMNDTVTTGRKKNMVDTVVTGRKKNNALDESMTLHNHKVVQKNKLSPLKETKNSKNRTPEIVYKNNSTELPANTKETKWKPATKTMQENKENIMAPKRKRTQKKYENNDKPAKVKTTKGKNVAQKQKGETLKKVEKKVTEKTSKKRKSEEPSLVKVQKKKKAEDLSDVSSAMSNMSDDEFLFGEMLYKKPTKPALQVLSPTSGILSVKKAAGNNLSKETPPCKALGLMLNASGHSTVSSIGKDAPATKVTQVVKRVAKIMENNKNKPKGKSPTNKGKNNQNKVTGNALKSYTTTTPLTFSKISIFDVVEELDRTEGSDLDEDDDLN